MPIKLKPDEFTLFQDLIEKISSIRVGDGKAYLIESRLSKMLQEYNCGSFSEFYQLVSSGRDIELHTKIIDAMSTQETLWFRDSHPFKILSEHLLPEYAKELLSGQRKRVRIWSAASSTGQEAYSVAMTILGEMKRHPHLRSHMFEIFATDIAPSAIRIATKGLYDRIAMGRGLPLPLRQKYFTEEGRYARISDEVKSCVTFKQFNLAGNISGFGQFDIILCRNVAIYFSDESKRVLFAKLKNALEPQGHLFLGSSESISAYSDEFELKEFNGAIYYRAKPVSGGNAAQTETGQNGQRKIA